MVVTKMVITIEEIHLLFFYYHCKQKHYEASR